MNYYELCSKIDALRQSILYKEHELSLHNHEPEEFILIEKELEDLITKLNVLLKEQLKNS